MFRPWVDIARALGAVFAATVVATIAAQQPRPDEAPAPGGATSAAWWLREGQRCLDRDDPWKAWQAFQVAAAGVGASVDVAGLIGLGNSHLMLGRSAFAHRYGEAAVAREAADQSAMALCVRALIRARAFDAAVRRAGEFLAGVAKPSAELLAARGSALFRVQRVDEAAAVYRRVVGLEPLNPEAHLRLGSGLMPPTTVELSQKLEAAVLAARAGRFEHAARLLLEVLAADLENPVAHRLLGEVLYSQRARSGMAASDPAFAALAAAVPEPVVGDLPVAEFVQGYGDLSAARRRVVDRAAVMFGRYLGKLVAIGSRHDILLELERTTDAPGRRSLRGKRTFDGRVWDDVRGIGGMRAATGIESLDEAAEFGFDTIAHEFAHQVHFYAFPPLLRARIKALYDEAMRAGRCIDYYAASNEAEYFGQGVEAFASLGKRPGGETTHGHTRFELYRVDQKLHDFVASVVDADPLADPANRQRILAAAAKVALRCGRPDDAVIATSWMEPGAERTRLERAAAVALEMANPR
ncbi:MAG: tetratricopeptide repeat protein [Planctomycetes bacterium]|nr:tetratricopeptide repeat protein [Planctomycetota bacterium]